MPRRGIKIGGKVWAQDLLVQIKIVKVLEPEDKQSYDEVKSRMHNLGF
jgi:hypothetical protein